MIKFLLCTLLSIGFFFSSQAQVLEAAYSEWDDSFEEWRIHINEDEYVLANRQFGNNPYRRWNFSFENLDGEEFRGFMQLKRGEDVNYWDFEFDNEHLYITTVYRDDILKWKIVHDDVMFTISGSNFGMEWEDNYEKNMSWKMYQVEERDIRNWYIDEETADKLTFPMRLAAIMIVIEMSAFGQ